MVEHKGGMGCALMLAMAQKHSKNLVLLVDDEEAFRMSVKDGLSLYRERFDIVTAADGLQALALIEKARPSLVVSDIRMPRMDGIELLLHCRKQYAQLPVILVSAYFSEELEKSAKLFGAAALLHKPLDLDALVKSIVGVLDNEVAPEKSTDGFLANFSLPAFLQLLAMEKKSCTLSIRTKGARVGSLWIQLGQVIDAQCGTKEGLQAALEILGWDNADITLMQSREGKRAERITEGINFLLIEAARIKDENTEYALSDDEIPLEEWDEQVAEKVDSFGEIPNSDDPKQNLAQETKTESEQQKEKKMASIEEKMGSLKDLSGFIAVGAFTAGGEMLAQVSSSGISLAELGALANDVLLKAQKSTDIMGVGRGNMVHITAPKANILVRCLNENTDFAANEPGRAHIHMVLVLESEGNIAMGKMQLEKVIQAVAPLIR